MKTGDTRIFNDQEKLAEMLNFRRVGWGIVSLSKLYGCSFVAIFWQCRRFGVVPLQKVVAIEKIDLPLASYSRWEVEPDGTRVNLGKSYKKYLEERQISPRVLTPW